MSLLYVVFLSRSRLDEESCVEPLSYRRERNKQAEEELHHISEKLSHRLKELDQVCVVGFCFGLFVFFLGSCHIVEISFL